MGAQIEIVTMKQKLLVTVGLVSMALLAGCNNAKSPDTAARDIAKADNAAAAKVSTQP